MAESLPTVAGIELLLTSMPFSAARRVIGEESIDEYNASSHTFTQMESLLVKLTDSDGAVGWGEAFGHRSNPATWAALEGIVAPFHLGRPADPATVRRDAEYAFHAFGRTGPVHFALSAVDIALWDLAAQRAGMPLRHLLTPQPRDTIDCYASLVHYGDDPVEVAHHISRAQEAGYASFKLHESSPEAVAAARAQAGPEAGLMTDVNCRWNESEASAALEAFAPADLLWLEEPVFPPDDTAALARLNARHGRISAGENASGVQGMVEQMRAGAVDYAQPSVGKIGGISAMREVLAAGEETGVAVVPHCFYYGPALNASAELIATLGEEVRLEVPFLQWPQRLHSLHGAGPRITLGDAPGLGFVPDERVLSEHLVRRAVVQSS
ncbi:mandelate racemase/muconate lactonizing enzyme family protein [Nesterenkonia xinjiangensis]|uniref:L-alanine-DL-glutamate epimerase-like enolase superfamily enzyme n=1 Tax=Nesterenkonia xinjiangensis TaxID=225327 RepID=A0A7Z0GKV2_9MICC|nr:mandelate racemase/muconate lactonizing enzyme family protein [Nesterenkonia xinjiangensis]NYJ77882.1 L-alanine-DL-glutamate epimerase-like enolase superfamily enzyme [Nesterenkonia xinjiangensis]